MAEIQSAYELTCSLREYNEQLEQARAARGAAWRASSWRSARQPYARASAGR